MITIQGQLVTVTFATGKGVPPPPVKRGTVDGFSAAARKRLIELLLRLDVSVAVFVTLTYPSLYPSPAESKDDLRKFWQRLVRRNGDTWAVWRLEMQKRGAPHYHLLVGYPYLPHEYVARAWYEVVGSGDEAHLAAGTRVEGLRSRNGVIYYASKYVAKQEAGQSDVHLGRSWGVLGRRYLPLAKEIVIEEHDPALYIEAYSDARERKLPIYDGQRKLSLYGQDIANKYNALATYRD